MTLHEILQPYKPLEPELNGTGVIATRHLPNDHKINFRAENLRPEKTGTHAKITIYEQKADFQITERYPYGKLIVYDTFNIGRDAERGRLCNSAFKTMAEIQSEQTGFTIYERDHLKKDLDEFCTQVWDVWIYKYSSELMAGDPTLIQQLRLKPFVVSDGGTIMFARPKSGKSFMALAIAVSVDSGTNKLWEVDPCNVLYVNLERSPKSMQRRLAQVNNALGIPQNRPLRFLHARGWSFSDISDRIQREVDKYDIRFVVLDSISRSGMGDLNDNKTANKITDSLNAIIQGSVERGYLAIAHTSWEEKHIYGSVMFEGAADVMVSVKTSKNHKEELGVQLEVDRANDIPSGVELPMLALSFNEFGLSGIRKSSPEEFPELVPQSNIETIRKYLLQSGSQTPIPISEETGINASTVRVVLSRGIKEGIFVKNGSLYGVST
tara:strand:+ start:416 stop:1729 length:1314 start_codon:yes stop_codon:yes gene_type:complete